MRNTIHGAALRSITVSRSGVSENPIDLSSKQAEGAVRYIESLDDDAHDWGLRNEHGRTFLHPDRYVEHLLPHALLLLNRLMERTAVERLYGVSASALLTAPGDWSPPAPPESMWNDEVRNRVRRLGGIDSDQPQIDTELGR
jgi:hypothetical protein